MAHQPAPAPDDRPVLLVRPDGNETDAAALATLGLGCVIDPYLEMSGVEDPQPAHRLVELLGTCGHGDWLVLTSARALPCWGRLVGPQLLAEELAAARARGLRIAAVGAGTAAALPSGIRAELIPQDQRTEGLLADLTALHPGLALLPRSALAPDTLIEGLTEAGWQVASAAVYGARPVQHRPATADDLAEGGLAAVLLRSPSAARAVAGWVADPHTRIIAVGPSTAGQCRALGWRVHELPVADPARVAEEIAELLSVKE